MRNHAFVETPQVPTNALSVTSNRGASPMRRGRSEFLDLARRPESRRQDRDVLRPRKFGTFPPLRRRPAVVERREVLVVTWGVSTNSAPPAKEPQVHYPDLSESATAAPAGVDPAPRIQARRSQASRQATPAGIDRAPSLRAGRGRGSGVVRRHTATPIRIDRAPLLRQSPRHVAPELPQRFRHGMGDPDTSLGSRPMPRGEGGHREQKGEGRGEEDLREDRREGETSHDSSPWRGAVRDGLHGRAGTSSGKIVPAFGSEEST